MQQMHFDSPNDESHFSRREISQRLSGAQSHVHNAPWASPFATDTINTRATQPIDRARERERKRPNNACIDASFIYLLFSITCLSHRRARAHSHIIMYSELIRFDFFVVFFLLQFFSHTFVRLHCIRCAARDNEWVYRFNSVRLCSVNSCKNTCFPNSL